MSAKINRRRFIAAGTAAVASPFLARGASAQAAWPSRNVRMVCSYPAGGQTDLLARAFGDFISRQVGQNVVVENKAGASGSIGAAEVARAAPDGHTILCSISTTYVMNRVMMKNPGYDMDKDLTLVSVIPGAGLPLVASFVTGKCNGSDTYFAQTDAAGHYTMPVGIGACTVQFGAFQTGYQSEYWNNTVAASAIASMVGCARQCSEMKAMARRTES